jgi:hypothetical protein
MNRLLLSLAVALGSLSLIAQTPLPTQPLGAPAPAPLQPPPLSAPAPPPAPETPPPAKAPKKPRKKSESNNLPFRGKIEAVDTKALTITLAGKEKQRVLHVTSSTRFDKNGHPSTFGDLKVGDEIRGSYTKTKDSENLVRVLVGAAPAGDKKPKAPGKKTDAPTEAK